MYNKDIILIGTSNIAFVDDSWKISKTNISSFETNKQARDNIPPIPYILTKNFTYNISILDGDGILSE